MRRISRLLCLVLASCTPGAPAAGTGSAAAASVPSAGATTINVSLTAAAVSATAYGSAAGYTPAVTTVPRGGTVRFVNVDSFAHTATSISGATFPAGSPFGSSALNASGATLSGGWSTGSLAAGGTSQAILADQSGTYLYGCFFHYGSPMRAAIVVP